MPIRLPTVTTRTNTTSLPGVLSGLLKSGLGSAYSFWSMLLELESSRLPIAKAVVAVTYKINAAGL